MLVFDLLLGWYLAYFQKLGFQHSCQESLEYIFEDYMILQDLN
ncbi:hypothetical protein EBME_0519 [bacterium endosymbiont of Mortierella elongata FMR23-6]|nr:hypothetical protein EBME_0519 [bacterium endosymbiont of Mortierella elongata FMR23-6]